MSSATICANLLADATLYDGLGQAVATSIGQASAQVEIARQAADQADCQIALGLGVNWLRWAQNTYGGDNPLADRLACAATQLQALVTATPSDPTALAAFQVSQLLPFQGVIASVAGQAAAYGPPTDDLIDLVAASALGYALLIGLAITKGHPRQRSPRSGPSVLAGRL